MLSSCVFKKPSPSRKRIIGSLLLLTDNLHHVDRGTLLCHFHYCCGGATTKSVYKSQNNGFSRVITQWDKANMYLLLQVVNDDAMINIVTYLLCLYVSFRIAARDISVGCARSVPKSSKLEGKILHSLGKHNVEFFYRYAQQHNHHCLFDPVGTYSR